MQQNSATPQAVLWTGQPSVFGNLEVEPPGSITYVFDETLKKTSGDTTNLSIQAHTAAKAEISESTAMRTNGKKTKRTR